MRGAVLETLSNYIKLGFNGIPFNAPIFSPQRTTLFIRAPLCSTFGKFLYLKISTPPLFLAQVDSLLAIIQPTAQMILTLL